MRDPIIPEEFLSVSLENHFRRYSKTGQWIYFIILVFIVLSLISLFLIKLELVVRSEGMIRPVVEKTELRSMARGRILHSYLHEDKNVRKCLQLGVNFP